MSKPDWKTKPHERKRMTLQQENSELKSRLETVVFERDEYRNAYRASKNVREDITQDAARYKALRDKDVMVLDGEPKYLKGEDLDKYCDAEKDKFWGLSMASMLQRFNSSQPLVHSPTKMVVQASMVEQAKQILKETSNGNDTRSESKEADQKDSGHHTDILRYADWYRLRKQRGA